MRTKDKASAVPPQFSWHCYGGPQLPGALFLAITRVCDNGRSRAGLLSLDFFGSYSGRHSAVASCGGFQPAATPSLSAHQPPTPPGGINLYDYTTFETNLSIIGWGATNPFFHPRRVMKLMKIWYPLPMSLREMPCI